MQADLWDEFILKLTPPVKYFFHIFFTKEETVRTLYDPSQPVSSMCGGPKVGPFQRVTRSRAGFRGGTAGPH